MTEDELRLWERFRTGDESARRDLILFYLPLVEVLAKRIARSANWAYWEDLRQDGVFGLMNAIGKFDSDRGVPFTGFARMHIIGAIYDSSELTRNLARTQHSNRTKITKATDELTKELQRNPTIEEVVEKTGLTIDQIENAIDAMRVAFAVEASDSQDSIESRRAYAAQQERAAIVHDALALLSERERQVIHDYYWEGLKDPRIAEARGLTLSNVTKIRSRALDKLRKRLDMKKKRAPAKRRGGHSGEDK